MKRGPKFGHKVSAETRAKISAANKGRKPSPEEIEKARIARIGFRHTEEAKAKLREKGIARAKSGAAGLYKQGHKHAPETIAKMKAKAKLRGNYGGKIWSEASKRKASKSAKARGAEHNWHKDGKGKERDTKRRKEMDRLEYRLWREAVYKRDNWTCQRCGVRGGRIVADHFRPWSLAPELRYDVSNGRTLCVGCHRTTPTTGRRPDEQVEIMATAEALLGG